MAEHYSFFDSVITNDGLYDREYNAQQFTDYFHALVTTGVMKGLYNELKVTANGSNMMTTIDTGLAFVQGKYYRNDAKLNHTHDTESLGKNRIDRIVVRRDLNTEARYTKSFIKKGEASTNPVAPPLTRDDMVYEISLAQVKITGGQTYISVNDVTDERGDKELCPFASSNILPNFDENEMAAHVTDYTMHVAYGVATGSANKYEVSLDAPFDSYVEGMALAVKINVQNTGSSTINVNGLGAKYIRKANGNNVSSGNLKAGSVYTLRYNGTNFILQGEGGGGNAQPTDVLSGKTFANDDGEKTGTMPNRGSIGTITPSTSQKNYSSGYYNSFSVRGDSNLTASNIRKGTSIFGVSGSFTGNYMTTTKSVTIPYNAPRVTISINAGFPPRYWMAHAGYISFGGDYYLLTGSFGTMKEGSKYFSDDLRFDQGYRQTSGGRRLIAWVHEGYDTYTSGNYLYFDLEFITKSDGFKSENSVDAQTLNVYFSIWG